MFVVSGPERIASEQTLALQSQSLFCDVYDTKTHGYCKKFKSVCPFHSLKSAVSHNFLLFKNIISFSPSDTKGCRDVRCSNHRFRVWVLSKPKGKLQQTHWLGSNQACQHSPAASLPVFNHSRISGREVVFAR